MTASLDQSQLREETVALERDNRRLPVFVVGPADNQACPALIVVHEIFGLNDHIRDVSRRFACLGLRVYAPDLFAEAANLPADRNDLAGMRAVWQDIPDTQLIADLKAVLALASSQPIVRAEAIGTLGFCMGGAIAFMFACESPEIRYVVDFYGRIRYPELTGTKTAHPLDYAAGLTGQMLGLFAGIDELIPPEHIAALEKRLSELGKSFQVVVYKDAPHAFFNDRRANYRADDAADAWQRVADFIGRATAYSPPN